MKSYQSLATAIIQQAVSDYKRIPKHPATGKPDLLPIALADAVAYVYSTKKQETDERKVVMKLVGRGLLGHGLSIGKLRSIARAGRKLAKAPKDLFGLTVEEASSAIAFFESSWFSDICLELGLDPGAIRERLSALGRGCS